MPVPVEVLLRLALAGWLLRGMLLVIRVRPALTHSTLRTAWPWLAAVQLLWLAAWGAETPQANLSPGLRDHLWYATAVCSLCPMIAVLGARRPGAGAWTWFVLLPLILVLEWPALAAWQSAQEPAPLQLELPALIPYVLVLVMGAGNFLGTRWTISSLLLAAALLLLVCPLSALAPRELPDAKLLRIAAVAVYALAIELAARAARRPTPAAAGWDRVWVDFRDWYGIVWARRLQDRFNHIADREQWLARLQTGGLSWNAEDETPERRRRTQHEIDQTFRWLLKRFVTPEWIESRLQ